MGSAERRTTSGSMWARAGLLLAVLSTAPALTLWWGPTDRDLVDAARTLDVVAHVAMLVAAALMYLAWRIRPSRGWAWLVVTVSLLGVQGTLVWAWRTGARPSVEMPTQLVMADLLAVASVVALLLLYRMSPPPLDPGVVGVVGGGLLSVPGIGWLEPTFASVPSWLVETATVLRLVLYAGLVVVVAALVRQPAWTRRLLTCAMALLAIGQVVRDVGSGPNALALLGMSITALGAALLCATALGRLRSSLELRAGAVGSLRSRMRELEERSRQESERLHETNAALAGVATAWDLLHDRAVPPERKGQLERMIESEMARLCRLAASGRTVTREVDLDATLEPVVTAQLVLGRSIDWARGGCRVLGRPDEIAEIVTTLLDNAAKHAPGAPVRVSARPVGGHVEVSVTDVGPGVAAEVADTMFGWGQRGPGSQGEGIGLPVARRLAEAMGGGLTWRPAASPGTTFVLTLERVRKCGGGDGVV